MSVLLLKVYGSEKRFQTPRSCTPDNIGRTGRLRQQIVHNFSVDVGESEIAAGVVVGQPLVVEAEGVEDGCLDVMHMERILDNMEAKVVGGAIRDARFDSAAGHPHREGLRMMVASRTPPQGRVRLHHRRAAEFAAPDHQRLVEHAALFQIGDQRSARLIGGGTVFFAVALHVAVSVPTLVVNVDKPHAPLDHPSREQTSTGEGVLDWIATVHFNRC